MCLPQKCFKVDSKALARIIKTSYIVSISLIAYACLLIISRPADLFLIVKYGDFMRYEGMDIKEFLVLMFVVPGMNLAALILVYIRYRQHLAEEKENRTDLNTSINQEGVI